MKPLIKSLLLYLMMVGLLAFNAAAIPFFPISTYIIYIIIIFVVLYFNEGLFWGKKPEKGLFFGAALMGTVFALELFAGWIKVEGFDIDPGILIPFFILQVLVSFGEELSFRGYILKNLICSAGIQRGIVLTSFMFSTIHLPSLVYQGMDASRGIIAFVVLGLFGAIASIIYLKFGLMSAAGFHFGWNFLQYNIFTLTGTQPGVMKSGYLEQSLLTGGSYGPEAGILGFIVVLFALVILIRKYSKSLN